MIGRYALPKMDKDGVLKRLATYPITQKEGENVYVNRMYQAMLDENVILHVDPEVLRRRGDGPIVELKASSFQQHDMVKALIAAVLSYVDTTVKPEGYDFDENLRFRSLDIQKVCFQSTKSEEYYILEARRIDLDGVKLDEIHVTLCLASND